MAFCTLTSDLGHKDPYLSVFKSKLLLADSDLIYIDLSHEVPAFDIQNAAWKVRYVLTEFPKNSIHVIMVDGMSRDPFKVIYYMDQYIISRDNGTLSLVSDGAMYIAFEPIFNLEASPFAQIAQILWHLKKYGLTSTHFKKTDVVEKNFGNAVYSGNTLTGIINYIDHFGNCVTNISFEEFDEHKAGQRFMVFFRNVKVKDIYSNIQKIPEGEIGIMFNASGHLEIGIKRGNLASLFGMKVYDMITIEFYGASNEPKIVEKVENKLLEPKKEENKISIETEDSEEVIFSLTKS